MCGQGEEEEGGGGVGEEGGGMMHKNKHLRKKRNLAKKTSGHKFRKFIFLHFYEVHESEISEALDLLHSSLDKPDGFEQVVDCVAAWQDLIDSSDSALRPLLECLDDDEPAVILGALRVVNALIHKAPDEARAFRIKNELSGISTISK
ncbi:unnamed protein product [Strongylus vulgaris]|uniref:Armadillo repeat-containing domain-containing protein n=1 Tax=Strongylus vulgaris TaxID=40348 RepID=A0A3P7JB49_STRVU|nr:unnamed protein product [Strongylus vulgaris]